MTQDIAVFDVLGPVYQYAEADGKIEDCVPLIEKNIQKLHPEKWKAAETDHEKYVLGSKMEVEFIKDGTFNPVATPGGIEILLRLKEEGIIPFVVSGGMDYTLQEALDKVIDDYASQNGISIDTEELIPHNNRISIIPIGSKKDVDTWVKARKNLFDKNKVLAGFEDNLFYCGMLTAAYGCIGCHVVSESNGLKLVYAGPLVLSGTMEQYNQQIKGAHYLNESVRKKQ